VLSEGPRRGGAARDSPLLGCSTPLAGACPEAHWSIFAYLFCINIVLYDVFAPFEPKNQQLTTDSPSRYDVARAADLIIERLGSRLLGA
jgi:hypothetical protein